MNLKTKTFKDKDVFKGLVIFNELCGITTSYKGESLEEYVNDPDVNEWTYTINSAKSYTYDVLVLCILLFTLYFCM
jgi:hypothetical protein